MQSRDEAFRSAPPPEAGVSRVTRFGSAVAAGALASLAASVPAALRVASAPDARIGALSAWLGLSAASLVPTIAAVFVLRAARRGLASFAGERAEARALGFVLWLFAALLVLTVFGAALRATTHHHGLAGATFSILGLTALGALAVFARRLAEIAAALSPLVRRGMLGVPIVLLGLLLLLLTVRVARQDAATIGVLIDAFAFTIASGFGSRASFARKPIAPALAIAGPPIAALVFALGVLPLRGEAIQAAVDAHAPLLTAPVRVTAGLVGGG